MTMHFERREGGETPPLRELHNYKLTVTYLCGGHGRLFKNETYLDKHLIRRCAIDDSAVRIDKKWEPK